MNENKSKLIPEAIRKATEALGLRSSEDQPMDWVALLHQHFDLTRKQGADALRSLHTQQARLYFAQASAYANVLAIYYQFINDTENAVLWAQRTQRYYARAFTRRNKILENIGGTMS